MKILPIHFFINTFCLHSLSNLLNQIIEKQGCSTVLVVLENPLLESNILSSLYGAVVVKWLILNPSMEESNELNAMHSNEKIIQLTITANRTSSDYVLNTTIVTNIIIYPEADIGMENIIRKTASTTIRNRYLTLLCYHEENLVRMYLAHFFGNAPRLILEQSKMKITDSETMFVYQEIFGDIEDQVVYIILEEAPPKVRIKQVADKRILMGSQVYLMNFIVNKIPNNKVYFSLKKTFSNGSTADTLALHTKNQMVYDEIFNPIYLDTSLRRP